MSDIHRNYVAGEWLEGEGATRNVNPSDSGDIVGFYAQATAAQVDAAVAAARAAFPAWSGAPLQERHDILKRVSSEIAARREELGGLLAREEGKTLAEAIGEVGRAAQIFDFFAGEALRIPGEKFASVRPGVDVEVTREGVGVVGIISPWNFPIAIPSWKIAPALCYGNCVVFKPADLATARRTRWPRSSPAPACPPACSISSWAAARRSARRSSTTGASTRSPSPVRSRPGARWRPPARSPCASSSSRWAARTRSSCSTTPI